MHHLVLQSFFVWSTGWSGTTAADSWPVLKESTAGTAGPSGVPTVTSDSASDWIHLQGEGELKSLLCKFWYI